MFFRTTNKNDKIDEILAKHPIISRQNAERESQSYSQRSIVSKDHKKNLLKQSNEV